MTAFIVLAAGTGKRFGGLVPKQFLKIRGQPILYWTLKKLEKAPWADRIFVALSEHYLKKNTNNLVPYSLRRKTQFVAGGKSRFESLKNALSLFDYPKLSPQSSVLSPDFIFVHDGCRPHWSISMVLAMLRKLKKHPKASGIVPLVKVRETVKIFNGGLKTLANREKLYVSQTPQLVRYPDLMKALSQTERKYFLDEAQILEEAGLKVLPCEGDPLNIKVTYPEDLRLCGLV